MKPPRRRPPAALVPAAPPAATALSTAHAAAAASARRYLLAAKAPNTVRAYKSDWRMFTRWCAGLGLAPLPAAPETVAMYVAQLADGSVPRVKRWRASAAHRPVSIERYLSAIRKHHEAAGAPSPTDHPGVRDALDGARRLHGVAHVKKAAALAAAVRAMAAAVADATPRGARDAAMLLLGFAGAFRRSELVALDWTDLEPRPGGLLVTIRRSKTDQVGAGRLVHVHAAADPAACPVAALERWRVADGGTAAGAVFRSLSPRSAGERLGAAGVARAVKAAAKAIGLDPARYAGHSLRRGFASEAARRGKGLDAIRRVTGHKSLDMLGEYLAADLPWGDDDAGAGLL